MAKQASANFLRALQKLGQQFVKNNGLAPSIGALSKAHAKPSKPWALRQPAVQAKSWKQEHTIQFDAL